MYATLLVAAGVAAALSAGPFDYDVVDIAPGVVGFVEKRLNPVVTSNIVAVIGSRSVLVFDAGYHPSITAQIVREIKQRTGKPVEQVVISHWHDDHWSAAAAFRTAYPKVDIVATSFTARLMETQREKFRGDSCKQGVIGTANTLRQQLAAGKRPDGTDIPETSKLRIANFIEAFDAHVIECDLMTFTAVTHTVEKEETFDLGDRRVIVRFMGRGNTAGDLIAYLPESKVLLTGDLVVAPFPFATQAYITEWATVLRKLDAMQPAVVVPGHGPIMHDTRYLRDVADVLESITSQARKAWKSGMTSDSLAAAIDLKPLEERFTHGDAFLAANFRAQMRSAVERMWQELSGQWKPEGIE